MLLLTRTGLSMSLSLATLDAVGRMKLDPVLRRTGAGELGTATATCGFVLFPSHEPKIELKMSTNADKRVKGKSQENDRVIIIIIKSEWHI